jgi:hypothetical protein
MGMAIRPLLGIFKRYYRMGAGFFRASLATLHTQKIAAYREIIRDDLYAL